MASQAYKWRMETKNALRGMRKALRTLDTSGEQVERILDRLILRKTQVHPKDIERMVTTVNNMIRLFDFFIDAGTTVTGVLSNIPL